MKSMRLIAFKISLMSSILCSIFICACESQTKVEFSEDVLTCFDSMDTQFIEYFNSQFSLKENILSKEDYLNIYTNIDSFQQIIPKVQNKFNLKKLYLYYDEIEISLCINDLLENKKITPYEAYYLKYIILIPANNYKFNKNINIKSLINDLNSVFFKNEYSNQYLAYSTLFYLSFYYEKNREIKYPKFYKNN